MPRTPMMLKLKLAPSLLFFVALIFGSVFGNVITPANAANYPGPSPKHPWYKVHVIAFKQPTNLAQHESLAGTVRELENAKRGVYLNSLGPKAFTSITADDAEFNAMAARIRRNYKVIYQQSWFQPSLGGRRSRAVAIRSNAKVGDRSQLEGTIELKVSRYIHTDFNLRLNQPAAATSQTEFSDESMNGDGTTGLLLSENRKMRSGQVHYIDHPAYGIVIKIVPVR